MKKERLLRIMFFALLCAFTFTSCGDDSGSGSDSENLSSSNSLLVGTWRYYFSHGFTEYTFRANGTGYYTEYDDYNNDSQEKDEFKYSYNAKKGVLKITYNNEDYSDEEFKIVTLTETTLIMENIEEGSQSTYYKKGASEYDDNSDQDDTSGNPSLTGTWIDEDGYGFYKYTFKANGTGYYIEYDGYNEDTKYEKYEFKYSYNTKTKKLNIRYLDGKNEEFKVIKLTSTTLILEEPDGDRFTYYKD